MYRDINEGTTSRCDGDSCFTGKNIHSANRSSTVPKIFVVDDEYFAREAMSSFLKDVGWEVEVFASCETFLSGYCKCAQSCLVLDVHLPGMGGLELLRKIESMRDGLPIIIVSGSSSISEAVQSIKDGALDFVEKPVIRDNLIATIRSALKRSRHSNKIIALRDASLDHIGGLTPRERQIIDLVLAGQPSKNIAADLGISQRTVENHRASIMHKAGAHSLPDLARRVMCSRCFLDA